MVALATDWAKDGTRIFQGPTFSGTTAYDIPFRYTEPQCIALPPRCGCAKTGRPNGFNDLPTKNNKEIRFRIQQLLLAADKNLPKHGYTDNQTIQIVDHLVAATTKLNNILDDTPIMLQFEPPNKTTVIANAEDVVLWTHLPNPTHFVSYQSGDGASNEWDVTNGYWEATFNPAGIYYFILTSPGYEDSLVKVTAVDA